MLHILRLVSIKSLLVALTIVVLAGCSPLSNTDFPVSVEEQADIVQDNINIVLLTPLNISSYATSKVVWHPSSKFPRPTSSWQYVVGVGDILSITVWDHPELTLPSGPERSQIESGSTVDASGKIFYPYIDHIQVAGNLVSDIQAELTEKLSEFIPDPQVEVKVAAFNSQKVVVTGAVVRPSTMVISNIPLTLLEAVNGAGGLRPGADDTHVTVLRNGQTYFIHLQAFLSNGRAEGNPVLHGGDIINVPEYKNNVAYVMGEIERPGTVDLGHDGVNLTEALTMNGGLRKERANAQGIFVFRANARKGGVDVFQLDATNPIAFVLATKFALHPQDVIYVVTDPAAQWNDLISTILPSVQAIRSAQLIGDNF